GRYGRRRAPHRRCPEAPERAGAAPRRHHRRGRWPAGVQPRRAPAAQPRPRAQLSDATRHRAPEGAGAAEPARGEPAAAGNGRRPLMDALRLEGARLLADCPDTRRLRALDLERNRLTEQGIAALRALGLPGLRVANQQAPRPEGGYNDEYLFEGDW